MQQIELLRLVADRLEGLKIPYAIVGSYASGVWGEPRMTRDIDVLVQLSMIQVASLCAAFPDPEFYVSLAAAREAVQHQGQFNVIHPASGNKIDFMIAGASDWTAKQLQRRTQIQFEDQTRGYVASPEDVILGKLLYLREGGSEKHVRDITGILKVQRENLDREYLSRSAAQLDVAEIWASIVERVY